MKNIVKKVLIVSVLWVGHLTCHANGNLDNIILDGISEVSKTTAGAMDTFRKVYEYAYVSAKRDAIDANNRPLPKLI